MPETAPTPEFQYDAFISYSHRDMNWARWLQKKLETFRVPKEFVPEDEGKKNFRVFRDQTDLAGVELQASLEKELAASRFLVVICSPASAASQWVNTEITSFQDRGDGARVIPFIVSGEPESENSALECFPPALRHAGRHALGSNVQEIGRDKAFLKLVSILLDVRFNRLVDREKQRRRRNILILSLILAVVIGTTSFLLWRNAMISRKNQALSYDIYGAAIVSFARNDVIEPAGVEFLLVSAQAGNTEAAYLLADCYHNGWGTEKDPEAAFYWFKKAAEDGDTTSMVAVSNCYKSGSGVEADDEQSFYWDQRAAEAGDAAGMLNVGIDYEEGIGVEKDEEAAFLWYRKSAESGYDLGMYNLARCYAGGIGTDQDPGEAFSWTKKLAETGNVTGMYNLAMMYQYSYGTEEDPRQAYLWYRKAAEAGDADAMYMTGWCSENGYGTEGDALEWYRRALENGKEEAAQDIERLTGQDS